nr:MAG TPA: hypothetical protein [Caudoviricetes sp.]
MVILKIWIGAVAALVAVLCLLAVLHGHSEHLGSTPVAHRT